MLTDSSSSIIHSLSQAINEKNVVLTPVPNSYLWELYKDSIVDYTLLDNGLSNNNLSLTETNHDLLQDKIISVLSKSLINQINLLKTEVVPVVDSLYEKTKELLKSSLASGSIESIEIIQKDLHDALKDPSIRNDIDKFKNIESTPLIPTFVSSEKLTDEMMNRIHLAATEYYRENTSAASSYIHDMTVDKLTNCIWNLPLAIVAIHSHDIIDQALDRYFINEMLRNNEDIAADLIDNTGLSDLRKKLDNIRTYTLPILSKNIDLVERRSNTTYGIVIIRVDRQQDKVYVNGPLYRKFLEQGGTVETILGVVMDKNASVDDYSINNLLEGKEKYTAYYKDYLTLASSRSEMELYNNFIDYFPTIFYNDRNNYGEEEEKYVKLNPGTHEEIKRRLHKELKLVRLHDLTSPKGLYKTISKIVAKTRFYYSGVYELMYYMEEEYKEGDDVANISAVAMIYYLVDYFFEQANVS